MTENREDLIRDLVADLRPVQRPGRVGRSLLAWLAIATAYSVLVVVATGPLREGALHNLLREPAFAGETLLALLAIVALAHAALQTAIPGAATDWSRFGWAAALTAAWAAVYVIGFWYPAHPVSTLGARPHCHWQALLFSVPSLALMLWLARRLLPLSPAVTGALAGAAAAAIPGALMQFGCMYVPAHILLHHLGPMLAMAVIGFLAAPAVLAARRTVPRSRNLPMH